MNLSELSNQELVAKLSELSGNERETTLLVLYHLIELEDRGIYRELGYSSLFDYCLRALSYSESSSGRRVAAARSLRENAELAQLFLDGKVNLCTIATAAKGLREKKTEVREIVGKSKREVELLVAPVVPRIKERIRPVVLETPKAPLETEVKREQRYTISFSLTKEVYDQFEEVKNRLSGKLGARLSVENVFKELIHQHLNRKSRTAKNSPRKRSRYVPSKLKQEVRARDGGQCAYVSPDGVRCTERHFLQFDHIQAFGLGGNTDSANLRLLCSCHNRLHAEQTYGKDFMSTFTGGYKIL